MAWGVKPELVIGDMDSADRAALRAAGVSEMQIEDQNSTDFEKCLRLLQAEVILAVGFTGLRLDHQLATFNTLARFPSKRVVLIGEVDICFVCPQTLSLNLPVGDRISMFPMGECLCTSQGLEWPLKGLKLRPDGQIATSNRVSDPDVAITVQSGHPIIILPKSHLEQVVGVLTGGQIDSQPAK